jgi:hypothetical protein
MNMKNDRHKEAGMLIAGLHYDNSVSWYISMIESEQYIKQL